MYDVNNEKKGFLFSFEVKVSTLIGFILIMMQSFAGQLKFQNIRFFLKARKKIDLAVI